MAAEERLMLRSAEVGMAVYDAEGEEVGVVQAIYPAVADPNGDPLSDAEMTGAPVTWATKTTWAESLAHLAELPEGEIVSPERARRLVENGFMCVEGAGLSGADRLIGCYQVSEIREDGVYLQAAEDEEKQPAGAEDAADQPDLGHDQHG
jgi:hypothetical protein